MDTKKHYKLYKDGKKWCVMALATLASIVSFATAANADDVNTTTSNVQTAQVAETGNTESSAAVSINTNNAVQSTSPVADQPAQPVNGNQNIAVQPQTEQSKNTWVQEDNGWTYYNDNGQVDSGRSYSYLPTIGKDDGSKSWYLIDNGVVQSGVQKWANTYYDFDANNNYQKIENNYVQSQWGDWYLFGNDGQIQTGVQKWAGTYYYFDPSTYLRVDNDYRQSQWGDWYLFGNDGRIQSGVQKWAGTYYYFDPSTYLRVDNDYRQSQWGDWYLFGSDGRIQSGVQKWAGTYYYFDPVTYLRVDNDYRQSQWGDWYLFGNDGKIQSGLQKWAGQTYYFDPTTFKKVVNADVTVNGVKYHLDQNGVATRTNNVEAKVNRALSQRGVPYVWGGNTPAGFDCSGLVQWSYGLGANYRTTYQQATLGAHHRNVLSAPKGALLFFGSDSAPYHVAISLGNGSYVHAPEPGDVVKIGYSKFFTPSFYINM